MAKACALVCLAMSHFASSSLTCWVPRLCELTDLIVGMEDGVTAPEQKVQRAEPLATEQGASKHWKVTLEVRERLAFWCGILWITDTCWPLAVYRYRMDESGEDHCRGKQQEEHGSGWDAELGVEQHDGLSRRVPREWRRRIVDE